MPSAHRSFELLPVATQEGRSLSAAAHFGRFVDCCSGCRRCLALGQLFTPQRASSGDRQSTRPPQQVLQFGCSVLARCRAHYIWLGITGHEDVIMALLSFGTADPSARWLSSHHLLDHIFGRDRMGATPLHLGAAGGWTGVRHLTYWLLVSHLCCAQVVQLLTQQQANPNAADHQGYTQCLVVDSQLRGCR